MLIRTSVEKELQIKKDLKKINNNDLNPLILRDFKLLYHLVWLLSSKCKSSLKKNHHDGLNFRSHNVYEQTDSNIFLIKNSKHIYAQLYSLYCLHCFS